MARHLADGIGSMDAFELWNDDLDIPVFAWQLAHGHTKNWSLFDLQDRLRMRGWLVPAYPMPADLADVTVQRIVARNGLSRDLAADLLDDIRTQVAYLDRLETPMPAAAPAKAFHH